MAELTAVLDCPDCQEPFEGRWPVQPGQDVEDIPPVMQQCTWCGAKFLQDYPHWQYFTEAG